MVDAMTNGIEWNPEIDPQTYGQLIFGKHEKGTEHRKG